MHLDRTWQRNGLRSWERVTPKNCQRGLFRGRGKVAAAYLPSFSRLRRRLLCTLFGRFLTFRILSTQVGRIFRWFDYLVLSTGNTFSFFNRYILLLRY